MSKTKIDLDAIEGYATDALTLGHAVTLRPQNVLALVRAVRSGLEAEELIDELARYARQSWDWKYGEAWTEQIAKHRDALAPFRKEDA